MTYEEFTKRIATGNSKLHWKFFGWILKKWVPMVGRVNMHVFINMMVDAVQKYILYSGNIIAGAAKILDNVESDEYCWNVSKYWKLNIYYQEIPHNATILIDINKFEAPEPAIDAFDKNIQLKQKY